MTLDALALAGIILALFSVGIAIGVTIVATAERHAHKSDKDTSRSEHLGQ